MSYIEKKWTIKNGEWVEVQALLTFQGGQWIEVIGDIENAKD